MGDVGIEVAHLIGWGVGMAFYGLYVCLFGVTMWILRDRSFNRGIVFWAIVALFGVSTVQTVICCAENYQAFIKHSAAPGAYFQAHDNPMVPIKDTFVYLGNVLADALVIWRLYVVWGQSKKILVAPILLLTISTLSGAGVVFFESKTVVANSDKYLATSINLTIVVVVATLIVNILTTGLIAGRLWWIDRQIRFISTTATTRYRKIIFAIIESGSLYTISMVSLIILYGAGLANAVFLAAYIVPMVIGIFPTLIVLQLNISTRINRDTGTFGVSTQVPGTRTQTHHGGSVNPSSKDGPLQVQVDVSQSKSTDKSLKQSGMKNKRSFNSSGSGQRHRRSSFDDTPGQSDDDRAGSTKGVLRELDGTAEAWRVPDLPRPEQPERGVWISSVGRGMNDDVELGVVASPTSQGKMYQ